MMREILGVADEASVRRRWFHDDYFDLFVWQAEGGEVVQFQLCYGVNSSEQALVWHKESGFFLDGVEAVTPPAGKISGAKPPQEETPGIDPVAERFEAEAHALPEDIRAAMTSLIQQFSEKKTTTPARRRRFRRASWQNA